MQNDCLVFQPTIATTYYGMNDGSYRQYADAIGDKYRNAMKEIVAKFKNVGVRTIVVGSPGVVDFILFQGNSCPGIQRKPRQALPDRRRSRQRSRRQLRRREFHDDGSDEKSQGQAGRDYDVAGRDGVHPGPNGHLITAYVFLKASDVMATSARLPLI